jgi:hypothetical protein
MSTGGSGVYGHSNSGIGVHALSNTNVGMFAESSTNYGVYAQSGSSRGVSAFSQNDIGVHGVAGGAKTGVAGQSLGNNAGVFGFSGGGALPSTPANTGVYGEASQDSTARGVAGKSTAGRGVYGQATSGQGVRGYATTGSALFGQTSALKSGVALRTVGRVRFDNSVGVATIAAGTKSVTVTPGIDLTTTSAVVATLQGNPGGATVVQRVAIDATADTFTIYLTANATSSVKVAWHVFG